ncbi:hypothetical protein CEXT_500511 [Caerostris extrusa]|uniref:Uncharacterized protein n=1 Tax=Caerostris extrusa TaxID=172846 RepID=A0AAV4N5D3_CAEEX|nr:hypothetical protein CEXT_500511 [Caerostris extrusa]
MRIYTLDRISSTLCDDLKELGLSGFDCQAFARTKSFRAPMDPRVRQTHYTAALEIFMPEVLRAADFCNSGEHFPGKKKIVK